MIVGRPDGSPPVGDRCTLSRPTHPGPPLDFHVPTLASKAVPKPAVRGPSDRLRSWFSGTLGRRLLRAERTQLLRALAPLRAEVAVQIGDPGWGEPLSEVGVPYHARVAASVADDSGWADGVARADALPLLTDSLDLLLLPHVLEFSSPAAVMKEAHRVLQGEGHLVVLGFEPWGVPGWWRWPNPVVRAGSGKGRFIGTRRLARWMAEWGFEVLEVRGCSHWPGLSCRRYGGEGAGLGGCLACRAAAPMQSAYLLVARLRCIPLTPIRPTWRTARLLSGGLAEPTATRMPSNLR